METESAPDHDVVWVINSDDGFGDYLLYRTYRRGRWWAPKACRPSPGTSPTPNRRHAFPERLPKIAKRKPVERDYTAWLGFRASPIRR